MLDHYLTKHSFLNAYSAAPGVVYIREAWNSSETEVKLLKHGLVSKEPISLVLYVLLD